MNSLWTDFYRLIEKALEDILIWRRPLLESFDLLGYPYEALEDIGKNLEKELKDSRNRIVRRRIRHCLTLLPFPHQWARLGMAEKKRPLDPVIAAFLNRERRIVAAKIQGKKQKDFYLRHFFQILKRPGLPDEKGILRIFSMPYLFTRTEWLRAIKSRYTIFAEPPMGLVFRHAWWRHYANGEGRFFLGVGGEEDMRFASRQNGVIPVQLAHGDFLPTEPKTGVAYNKERKQFDLVFNALFSDPKRKRHDLFLSLLRHPALKNKTALLLGRGGADDIAAIKKKIKARKLEGRVVVKDNLRRADVDSWLAKCQMGVHLSLYENECRAIFEYFRSNLPVVVSSSMAGMNMKSFNALTGMAVPDKKLAWAIQHVLNNRRTYRPREWFLKNNGSQTSSTRLNDIFKAHAYQSGEQWTKDIVPLSSSGANRYAASADYQRFLPEFHALAHHVATRKLFSDEQLKLQG